MASVNPAPAPPLRAKPRGRSKLRVGVFADRGSQPRWLVDALARVATSDFAELAVLAVKGEGSTDLPALWKAYGTLDRWVFGHGPDPLKPTPLELLVKPAQRIAFVADDRRWRERIESLRLDVAFVVGDIDDASLAGLARHGIWRHCFGDDGGLHDQAFAGVREIVDEKPVVASGIRIHRACGERLACPSYSRTVPFSLARSHDRIFGRASEFLPRALRKLYDLGEGWLERDAVPAPPLAEARAPGVAETVRGITTLGARVARRTIEHCFTVGQWSLAFRFAPLEPWQGGLEGFHRLVPPPDRFWADPFPLSVNGRHYIFFEELPFETGKGRICMVEVDRAGHASAPVTVLERDYHLSYPFLLEHEGELYMIPETGQNRTVEMYRCEEFPSRWAPVATLLDGGFYVDATLHREDDRWWMFANVGSDEAGADDELHLFSAATLFGEWKPHARNPVKCDVRSSRPAGRLFRQGDQLFRPGQICAPIYGSGVALHRVLRLDDEQYAEQEDRRIVPCAAPRARGDDPVLGLHTINRAGELSVTDAFVRRRRF